MERISVSSSALKSVGYDPQTETLEVEFSKGDVWQYSGVPASVYEALISASSVGSYFQANIKNSYAGRKV